MLAQAANHVASVRGHHFFTVLQDFDRKILWLVDLFARYDPRAQCAEGVEALANITCVMHALALGIALADIPADRITEDVIERLRFAHFARALADHRAELALEVDELRNLRQDDRVAGTDDR